MTQSYDVVIAGGGVMGCAIAYFLGADPTFGGSVLVVERDPSYANCATTRSWGGIRQQFSTPENVRMSLFAADFIRQAGAHLAVEGEAPDLAFREQGYLFLASASGRAALERNVALQRGLGAEVLLLEPPDLAARFPWLSVEGLAAGALGPRNEGWIDPSALMHAFRRKARALAALAGIELPVRPRKRTTYVFDCREPLPPLPLTIDPSGVAFRPEGDQYLAIVPPPPGRDRDSDDLEPDYDLFEDVIWPTLAARVPAFTAIKQTAAWAGHYDTNTFDQNAILGAHPEITNLLFCNGFSGHGLQQSPAAGRALAELIVHGRYRTLDLSALGFARIPAGRPLREINVV